MRRIGRAQKVPGRDRRSTRRAEPRPPQSADGGLTLRGVSGDAAKDEAVWAEARARYEQAERAGCYDARRERGLVRQARERWMRRLLGRALEGVAPGSTVLDLPCGTGRLTGWLVGRGYRVLSADLSGRMLAEARSKSAGAPAALLKADAERLPLADAAVDAALVVRFLHLVAPRPARLRIFAELARVTRQRVVLAVSFPHGSARDLLRTARGKALKPPGPTRDELIEELAASGLVLERRHDKLPFFSTQTALVCRPG